MVFDLRFETRLSGPCMRCLGHADVPIVVSAREIHDLDGQRGDEGGDELRSDYVAENRLDIDTWTRDAIALALPEQILCNPDRGSPGVRKGSERSRTSTSRRERTRAGKPSASFATTADRVPDGHHGPLETCTMRAALRRCPMTD
jgi:uncharacterized metal-binding protein YceD (DUF177 family)